PVGSELDPASVMDGRAGNAVENDLLNPACPAATYHAHDAVPEAAAILVGVIRVNESGAGEIRCQGQPQQSAFPHMRHLDLGPWLRVDSAVTDDADAPRPFSEEEAAVGGKLCFP